VNGASAFSGPKQCQHFPQEWVSERCHFETFTYPPPNSPCAKNPKSATAIDIVSCRTAALLLSSPSSSWFHCSSGHRFGTSTWSNPASGPEFLSPESDAPRSSLYMYASPPFHTTTLFPGGCMQCTYALCFHYRAHNLCVSMRFIHTHTHTLVNSREHREGSAAAQTFGFPAEPVQRDWGTYDFSYQSTLDAVYVYVVPWSEFPIVPSYPHYPHMHSSSSLAFSPSSPRYPRSLSLITWCICRTVWP